MVIPFFFYGFFDGSGEPPPPVNEVLSGGKPYRLFMLDKQEWKKKLPKKAKKAIVDVAKLKLDAELAETSLRMRLRDIEWDNSYLNMQIAMQQALELELAYTLQDLERLQLEELQRIEQLKIAQQKERNKRISLIMMLA
jgi:hypothetical protein